MFMSSEEWRQRAEDLKRDMDVLVEFSENCVADTPLDKLRKVQINKMINQLDDDIIYAVSMEKMAAEHEDYLYRLEMQEREDEYRSEVWVG